MKQANHHQRYDALDNMRVLAFGVLILYHIGMYYVADWGWHIKSDVQFVWLQDVMILTNQWRMSLLFLISAMVLGAVLSRRPALSCLKERTQRLLLPLVFGMFVVVAPQAYVEGRVNGLVSISFWEFYGHYINPATDYLPDEQSVIGLLTWNHLWFLPYLFCYSVIVAGLYPLLTRVISRLPGWTDHVAVFLPLVVTATTYIWLNLREAYPVTHDLISDWYNHAKYGLVMLVGMVIVNRPLLWRNVVQHRRVLLLIAMCTYTLLILDRHGVLGDIPAREEAPFWLWPLIGGIVTGNHWCWLGAILGYGSRYLARPSSVTRYFNQAVLPYYMLHQTLIVVLAYVLSSTLLPASLSFLLILAGTVVGCMLSYEGIKRVPGLRSLFGLKGRVSASSPTASRFSPLKG
ncbi:acyltransferase family protein [Alteromonas halophila]|uniref:Acyltransferase n=1 Tax=Alteromonas halophila TaxID=516698 RepID=A0A918JM41_9ALTE|nr:acyltransferase family protein [Alteromonas halophila]GGW86653.1 acyltransferase [Alteromonas halophila]